MAGGRGDPGALVLDGRLLVAGVGVAPELARQRGDHDRGPAAAPVPERRLPVVVLLGAGACPPAGAIMAGGLRRPPFPLGSSRYRCGRVPDLARQWGGSWPEACGSPGVG
ncbi:hypothetical protein KAM354_29930 [Aeromonas caviae]|nr:hypothetical protein KAM354_29930 [Aeromonas caviae]